MPEQLFSIDVDAHLKKAASHTFGSPAHYPVELVRAAIKRGATKVNVNATGSRLMVEDNGRGLDASAVETLTLLMDPSGDTGSKEAAVESLQARESMGLLAIFAADPEEIMIENVNVTSKHSHTIHFRAPRFQIRGSCNRACGTAVTLTGKHRDTEREKNLLEVFCRSVTIDLHLNGKAVGKNSLLTKQLGTLELAATEFHGGGQIGIPRNGTLCHLRLLDHGIPWHHMALAPQEGFVFDAALEFSREPTAVTRKFIRQLQGHVLRLYQWLCKRYSTAEPYHQERIEELVFTHCRLTGDVSLVHQFAPFRMYKSPYSADLAMLRESAAKGNLYAVPAKKDKQLFNIASGQRDVYVLSREQADLLINHLNLPVVFLSPVRVRAQRWKMFKYAFTSACKKWVLKRLPVPGQVLDLHHLTADEARFMETLNRYLADQGSMTLRADMVDSRAPFPALPFKNGRILIRRHHALVRRAVQLIREEDENIEIVAPVLMPDMDGDSSVAGALTF